MLRITLIFLALISFKLTTYSQEIDKRLLPKFSEKELFEMQKNDPKEYTFLVNALDKAVFIGEIPDKKDIKFDGVLKINPNEVHTFISLGKEITDSYQYYKIKGTTKMLGILPRFALDNHKFTTRNK
ncbi:MAG: hypothetical protein V4622_11830 [Bacteroidota bacterium]